MTIGVKNGIGLIRLLWLNRAHSIELRQDGTNTGKHLAGQEEITARQESKIEAKKM
jgi:hypothetical protein